MVGQCSAHGVVGVVGHDDARLTDRQTQTLTATATERRTAFRGVVPPTTTRTWSTGGCIASGGGGHGELRAHFQRCELGGTSYVTLTMVMMMMMTMRSKQASMYPQLHGGLRCRCLRWHQRWRRRSHGNNIGEGARTRIGDGHAVGYHQGTETRRSVF